MKPPSPAELRDMLADMEGQGALAARRALAVSLAPGKVPQTGVRIAGTKGFSGLEQHKEKLLGAGIAAALLFALWKVQS